MCGIAGIYRFRGTRDDTAAVHQALDALIRRGPDGIGHVAVGPATLGHRRLRILDLSEAGRQPMRSRCERYLITFNGEIYNYHELRDSLGLDPATLRSTTDTEVLLEAWARLGPAALDRLVGQFAFCIYDTLQKEMWVARDRFGEKPLFYHQSGEALAFASTLTALMRMPGVPRELDDDAMLEYVTMRYVVAPRTVVRGVRKLPAGHLMHVTASGSRVQRWFTPRYQSGAPAHKSRDELAGEFGALFDQACKRTLVSDVPVALLLSDGIDSNAICHVLDQQGAKVPRLTYRLADKPLGPTMGDLATGPGMETIDLVVNADDRIKAMAEAFGTLSEPVGDGAALATFLLIRNARHLATVFLCGHGADEVLGGYRLSQDRFRLAAIRSLAKLHMPLITQVIDRHTFGSEAASVRRRRLVKGSADGLPANARYIIHRPLPTGDVTELTTRSGGAMDYLATVDRLYGACPVGSPDIDRIQEVMIQTFLTENILSFADSVAMSCSAELRMPFLDRDLVNFVFNLPPEARVSRWPGRANTKLILRWWGKGSLSPTFLNRRKAGFAAGSLRTLMATHRAPLRDYIVGSPAVRRAIPGVDSWLSHEADYYRGPWQGTLWALLALGIWAEAAGAT